MVTKDDGAPAAQKRSSLRNGVRWAGGLALGGAVLLLVLASALPAAPPKAAKRTPPNLVLITLDTTRADHLGASGYGQAHTPNLDALAARGTRFARCDTAAPITLPSHATLLTGLFPPRHGVRDNGTFVLSPKVETLAERLAARGYDTAAVVSAVVLARRQGLDQGFRVYDDDLGEGYAAGTLVAERPAEATTAAALAALKGLRPPFFLWVHYFDPHEEYRPPTRFADRAKGPHRLYDGEISYMDEQVGELLKKLPQGTDVIAVGDHGEMLGEHGEQNHGLLLYRGVRRVPLIAAGPDVPAGKVSDCLVRTADVTPTLLALAGVNPPGLDGQSLLPLSMGKTCSRQTYTESFLPFFAYKWYPLRALGGDRYLFMKGPKSSLYDLSSDAAETRDLASKQPAAARTWEQRLVAFLKGMGESVDVPVRPENVLSEEQRRQLASLGYLGGTAEGPVTASLPDPRVMTTVAHDLHVASKTVQEGRCKEALPALNSIVKRDPHNFPALSLAGFCLRQAGRTESALALFQRAAKENDLNAVPIADAAGCLLDLGRKQEAEREFRRALALDPSLSAAAASLARMLRDRGERKEAQAVLDTALRAGAHDPEVYLERGLTRAESGSLDSALGDFREAARRDPANPVPVENAARAAYQLGRRREAVQLYEQILKLQPGRLDLWKTTGAIYLYELEDRPAALRCFRSALNLEASPAERVKLEELIKELDG
ncbi:MAG TPA: sulfatase-like hydrolase/transferase [Thermoanaerobaculia bacterium]|jgi:arylsulfatase A-like enzyme/Flp pilus assembly protein TadD|nr:sulfatase-like hydrolase/transferase [Thermoanaerobaculia bacterium]